MHRFYKRYGEQLGRPRGLLGRWLIKHVLVIGNAALNRWAIGELELQPHERVLEIGCGPGRGLRQSARQLAGGLAVGIDYSPTMLKHAWRYNAELIHQQRLHLDYADAAAIPFQEGVFDAAYAVNVIYFWPDALATLREIWRVLRPGGRILIAIRPDELVRQLRFPQIGFTSYTAEQCRSILGQAGFRQVQIVVQPPTLGLPGLYGAGIK